VSRPGPLAKQALREMREQMDQGAPREAFRRMCLAMALDSAATTCETVSAAMETLDAKAAGLAEQRVALLTNFTAEPLVPFLVANAATSGMALRPYVPGFDTWAQEIADPESGLRHHRPDVVILDLRLEALCPRLIDEFLSLDAGELTTIIDDTAERIGQSLRTLRGWSAARIVLPTFPRPLHPTLGIIDHDQPHGQTAAVAALNDRVARIAHDTGNVFLIDTDRLRARLGESQWHDARLWALARLPNGPAGLQAIAQEYVRVLRALAGRARKVLVLDADDTLWGGILGEVGDEGIALGASYPGSAFVDLQRAVLEWHRRGIVLALISSNDEADVRHVLDTHPAMLLRSEHFAAMRINWRDKAENLADLAEELGLAPDSFVFVDDNIVECDRVRQAWPEVLTIHLAGEPANRAAVIRSVGVFDSLNYGKDDRSRVERYRTEASRRNLQRELPSLDVFYQSLEMMLIIEPITERSMARAADLTQRTNQFNLCPRRYTAAELAAALARGGVNGFVFSLRDRFGDYGLIGFAMLEGVGADCAITQLLLSCRVLKRTVEDSVLAFLVDQVRAAGARDVVAMCLPTARNGVARECMAAHGFESSAPAADGTVRYRLAAERSVAPSPWIYAGTLPGTVP
jgi:FkbH-like protein